MLRLFRQHVPTPRWVCETDGPRDRFPAKEAGFRWSPDEKIWWTDDDQKALKLREFAGDHACEAALDAVIKDARDSIVASRAVDADIDIPAPEGLEYLPYQKAGINFALQRKRTWIGDEMGLGKTIQAIGVLNGMPAAQNVLVICPASLKLNWAREIEKWSVRDAAVAVARGGDLGVKIPFAPLYVQVINFDILKRHRDALRSTEWDLLIVDESHYLKNPKAGRTVEVIGKRKRIGKDWGWDPEPLKAEREVWLSGTPITNRPAEAWVPCRRLAPEIFRNWKFFHVRYCDARKERWGWNTSGASNLSELQDKLRSSVLVRRLKRDVLTELPAKRRQVIELPSNGFANLVKREKEIFSQYQATIDELRKAVERAELTDDREAYAEAVAELKAGVAAAFSAMSKVRHEVAVAKVPMVVEQCKSILEQGSKLIVFAHHKDVVAQIVAELDEFHPVQITGDTGMDARQAAVDRFQDAPDCRVFVGNIQAAGVGITLTASSTVVFAELDWVPGNISQAEDRAHRIGQHESVLVQHLVLEESLDAYMAHVIVEKQKVLDAALDEQTDGSGAVPAAIEKPAEPKPARKPVAVAPVSQELHDAVLQGVRILSGQCDGARLRDDVGFNGADTEFGHSLAARSSLSPKQVAAGKRMLLKYHRQLTDEINVTLRKGES